MSIYLKKAQPHHAKDSNEARETVEALLAEIREGREDTVRALARKFDRWDGEIVVSAQMIEAAKQAIPSA